MTFEEPIQWKYYCPECHHTFVSPKAIAENLKVAYIDFKCQGCGQQKTILVLLKEDSVLKKL